ncbi:hypothetical protein B0H14DRAFT_3435206 [Mycena olivaceomarginata]|nr:hypothetical protein B0H14DRAFT_3435206 [Mycena olivaceomarginata]
MKLSITTFVALALASLSLASPTVKRHGPGKRGLLWTWYNGVLDPGRLNDGQGTVNLIYDYETYTPPSTNGNGGLAFIGMQRCADCDSSPIAQLAARQQQLGFNTIFTLNEPNQNRITPATAAQWFGAAIKKALPAVSSSTSAGQGLDWVQQMVSACAGGASSITYINIVTPRQDMAGTSMEPSPPASRKMHWYGQTFADFPTTPACFSNNQIVITEFGLQNPASGQAAQLAFFYQAFAFLDAATFVSM